MLKCISFDLDDTLLDTSGLLIAVANQEACQAMIKMGLNCTLEECLQAKAELSRELPHEYVFDALAEKFGYNAEALGKTLKTHQEVIKTIGFAGFDKFYRRKIPAQLPCIEGVEAMLTQLKQKYRLFLVTTGDVPTQVEKVKALRIAPYFEHIFYVDVRLSESKRDCFDLILTKTGYNADELLSVGNRLDQEIELAKRCGAQTCFVKHGEHRHAKPQNDFQKPDFEVNHIREVISICQL